MISCTCNALCIEILNANYTGTVQQVFWSFHFELSLTEDRTHNVPCATIRPVTKASGLAHCATCIDLYLSFSKKICKLSVIKRLLIRWTIHHWANSCGFNSVTQITFSLHKAMLNFFWKQNGCSILHNLVALLKLCHRHVETERVGKYTD